MKKIIVLSLGGSLIVPKEQDEKFLENFKKTLRKNYRDYKFVVVCGGGTIARKYISVLKEDKQSKKALSLAGIRATRMNAQLMMQLFGKEANSILPVNMKQVKDNISQNDVVFCGALRYSKSSTSDTTAVKLAYYLKTYFINLTDVDGLYTKNPKKYPNARLINKISWKKFEEIALKIKYKAGQNFILDQQAAVLVKKYKIPTYIIGKGLHNLTKILHGKNFIGTLIQG